MMMYHSMTIQTDFFTVKQEHKGFVVGYPVAILPVTTTKGGVMSIDILLTNNSILYEARNPAR
jgi:hypothetical protein